jgi:dimethylamine corrinoid protein
MLGCDECCCGNLKPHLRSESSSISGPIVIGVVEGDTHDIGKNLVRTMLESSGFTVYDLGRDVPLQHFIDEAERTGAQMICLSTLMTTAMGGMEEVIRLLTIQGLREKYKILIGGGPVSSAFAVAIQADGYASNAVHAVRKAKELLNS